MRDRKVRRIADQIEDLTMTLAKISGELAEKADTLGIVEDYEQAKKQLVDLQLSKERLLEDQARKEREIEHRLGLHRIQVEQERTAAIQEAKLAVREEALSAQEGRFKQEMEFMQGRFEQEVASQRKLVEQVLERLPTFQRTYSTVEHIGQDPDPKVRLELETGDGT